MNEKMLCKQCGTIDFPRVKVRGSFFIEIILWFCFLVPGIIYTIWRMTTKEKVCSRCGSSDLVPLDTPFAKEVLKMRKS